MRLTRETTRELCLETAIFAACAAEIALCHGSPLLLTGVLIATGAVLGASFWRRIPVIILYLSGAILGPLGETIGVRSGAWQYSSPMFLGIPLWLPFAWGAMTVLIRAVSDTITKMANHQHSSPADSPKQAAVPQITARLVGHVGAATTNAAKAT